MRRIQLRVPPMSVSLSLYSVKTPTEQTYNSTTDEYLPDRELTPTILFPEVTIADPSGMITEKGNRLLSEVQWLCNGNPISGSDLQVDDTPNSATRGLLKVYRNGSDEGLLLEFRGTIYHPATRRKGFVTGQIQLTTTLAKTKNVVSSVLCPKGKTFNALQNDDETLIIQPTMKVGEAVIPSMHYLYSVDGENRNLIEKGFCKDFLIPKSVFSQSGNHSGVYEVCMTDCQREVHAFCKRKGKAYTDLTAQEKNALSETIKKSLPTEEQSPRTEKKHLSLSVLYPPYTTQLVSPYLTDSGDIVLHSTGEIEVGIQVIMRKEGVLSEDDVQRLFEVQWAKGKPFSTNFTKSINVQQDMELNPIIKEKLTGNTRTLDL